MATRIKTPELGFTERLRHLRWSLVAVLLLIGGIGYLVLYSAGGGSHQPWALKHGVRLGVCLVLALAIGLSDLRFWFKWAYPIYGGALLMLVAVEVVGEINKGAERWINLGFMQLQPSEVMKVALVLALARYFHSAWLEDVKNPLYLLPPLGLIGFPALLVLKQPDLGTTVTLVVIGAGLLFVAGVRLWKFLTVGAVGGAALPVIWSSMHAYQRQRVLTFLDPESDPLGSGYHIIQSKIALGSGGLWGKGYLQGSQAQLSFLPEKQTDFAFTMLAEEAGLVGAAITLGLCFTVLVLTLSTALRSANQFGRLVAMGIGVNYFLYVVINVAMVAGLIPVVGVPLPLVSYGGTAMLTVMTGFGLVLCVDVNRGMQIPRFPTKL